MNKHQKTYSRVSKGGWKLNMTVCLGDLEEFRLSMLVYYFGFPYLSVCMVLSKYSIKLSSTLMSTFVHSLSRSTSAYLVTPYFTRQFGFEK